MMRLGLAIGAGNMGATETSPISAIITPALSPLDETQTPADGFSTNLAAAANYTSSEGTILSVTVIVILNGTPQAPGVTNQSLVTNDTVRVQVTVTDSLANERVFLTVTRTVTASVGPDQLTYDSDPMTYGGDNLIFNAV